MLLFKHRFQISCAVQDIDYLSSRFGKSNVPAFSTVNETYRLTHHMIMILVLQGHRMVIRAQYSDPTP
jgi:hypothetical protein